MIITNPTTP